METRSLEQLTARRNGLNRRILHRRVPAEGESHAQILDDYFRDRFSVSLAGFKLDLIENPYAIIATGGYGRKEIFPSPEASILFIFKDLIPHGATELIRDIVYPLWDLGYTISHSTKTLKDSVDGAANDFGALCSLLDSRFICGVSPLYSSLMSQLWGKIVSRRKKDILAFLYSRDEDRHKKFQGPDFLLEPDLFSSPGGLKDVHSLMWAARVYLNASDIRDIEKKDLISGEDLQRLREAAGFIRSLVEFLHLSSETNRSRLVVDRQEAAAHFLNYRKNVNLLLSDLEKHRAAVRVIRKRLYSTLLPERPKPGPCHGNNLKTGVKWVTMSKGFIRVSSLSKLKKHPELVLAIFEESEKIKAPISPETLKMLAAFTPEEGFHKDPGNLNRFENILLCSSAEWDTGDILAETGLLFSFIPEFKDLFHRTCFTYLPCFPMGKHRLLTVYHIKRILDDHENKGLSLSPESQLVVLWAGFLHGLSEESCSSGDAHRKTSDAVQQILARFHKPPMFIRRVLFLLTCHNMLMHLIHEEDPGDENAVKSLIKGISSPEDLALAHVSALADLRAQAFPALYHFKESDLNSVTAICTRLGGFEDAHGIPMGFHPDPAPEILASCDDGPVRVDIIKQGAIRAVKARFESCSEPVLPALAALENSGLELYDLKVISEKNRGRHVLLRVKAPRDTLFEMKKWAGFQNLLKDCASRAFYPSQPPWGDPATETEMSRKNPVTLHTRHCGSGLVLNIGYPGVVPIYPLVKALVSNGLSPFYLKKTCDRKTYRLVLHMAPAEGAAPDHNALKEVIHALFKP